MNTIILRRVNIGNDAVVREIESQKVIEFSVADNRHYKDDKGETKEATTWYKCNYWTNRTSVADYLKKGVSVNVLGRLTPLAYLNKNGQPACDLRVSVSEIDFLSKVEVGDHQEAKPEALEIQEDKF